MLRAESETARSARPMLRAHPGRVQLWRVDLRREMQAADLELLGDAERARLGRYRLASDRRRFAVRRLALRRLLAAGIGADPASLRFDTRCRRCGHPSHGKPRLVGPDPVPFTIARAGDLALVALAAEGELGIDVEETSRPLRADDLEPVLAEGELSSEAESGRAEGALHRLWTRKEALGKAIGVGLAGEPSELDTCTWPRTRLVVNGPAEPWTTAGGGARLVPETATTAIGGHGGWWLYDLPTIDGCTAALAANRPVEEAVLLDAG